MHLGKFKQNAGSVLTTARREWDRVLYDLILIGFGAYSFINPVLSVQRALPLALVEFAFNIEFILAGLILLVGTLRNKPKLQGLGHLISALGMFTVGTVIALLARERGLAYALLLYAATAREINQFRRARKTVTLGEEEIREIVSKEMAQVLTAERPSEGTGDD